MKAILSAVFAQPNPGARHRRHAAEHHHARDDRPGGGRRPAQAATAVSTSASTASTATSTASTASPCPRPSGAVGCTPAPWPPHLLAKTSKTNQIRQIVQCGSRMYAVGTFQLILGRNPRTGKFIIYHRSNAFSFEATRPYAVTSWNPNANGQVNSIAVGQQLHHGLPGRKLQPGARQDPAQRGRGGHRGRRGPHRLRGRRQRCGGDAAAARRPAAHRRLLHQDQRCQRSLLRRAQPDHRQAGRLPAPGHLRQLHLPRRGQQRHPRLQPADQPRRRAAAGRRRLHLGWRASRGSRSS